MKHLGVPQRSPEWNRVVCSVEGDSDLREFLEAFLFRRPWWLRWALRARRLAIRAFGMRRRAPPVTLPVHVPMVAGERAWMFTVTRSKRNRFWAGRSETQWFESTLTVSRSALPTSRGVPKSRRVLPVVRGAPSVVGSNAVTDGGSAVTARGRSLFEIVSAARPRTRGAGMWLRVIAPVRRAIILRLAREAAARRVRCSSRA